jgi:hypothetical protein
MGVDLAKHSVQEKGLQMVTLLVLQRRPQSASMMDPRTEQTMVQEMDLVMAMNLE